MLARIGCLGLVTLTAAMTFAAPTPSRDSGAKLDKETLAKIRKLQLERRDELKKAMTALEEEFLAGRGTLDILLKTSRLLLQAELDVATTAAQRVAAHAAHLRITKRIEKVTRARHEAGRAKQADTHQARAARLEAEIDWLKAGGREKAKDRQ